MTTDNSPEFHGLQTVSPTAPLPVSNGGAVTSYNSVSTNTKTFTLSDTHDTQVIFAHVNYTADSTTGSRYVVMSLINGSSQTVGDWHTSVAITAGQSGYHVEFLPGTYRETAFDAEHTVQSPFPIGLIVPAGYTLKIADASDVSTGDSMVIGFQYKY